MEGNPRTSFQTPDMRNATIFTREEKPFGLIAKVQYPSQQRWSMMLKSKEVLRLRRVQNQARNRLRKRLLRETVHARVAPGGGTKTVVCLSRRQQPDVLNRSSKNTVIIHKHKW